MLDFGKTLTNISLDKVLGFLHETGFHHRRITEGLLSLVSEAFRCASTDLGRPRELVTCQSIFLFSQCPNGSYRKGSCLYVNMSSLHDLLQFSRYKALFTAVTRFNHYNRYTIDPNKARDF
jgi:hypothetical protein